MRATAKKYMSDDSLYHHIKHKFSIEEDQIIIDLVARHGEKSWRLISTKMANRTPRQCRERWRNYLSPVVQNLPWTDEEDAQLLDLTDNLGKQWAKIAKHFEKRTDTNVKNRWSLLQRKRHRKQAMSLRRKNKMMKMGNNLESSKEVNNPADNTIESTKETSKNQTKNGDSMEPMIKFWDQHQWDILDESLNSKLLSLM